MLTNLIHLINHMNHN